MRVSNIAGQDWTQGRRTSGTQRKAGAGFSDLLKKETAVRHRDTAACRPGMGRRISGEDTKNAEEAALYDKRVYKLEPGGKRDAVEEASMFLKVPMHINDLMNPVELNLDNLTEEKKAELNEKYHIQDIAPGSPEYRELLSELEKDGILSNVPCFPLRGELVSVDTDEDGNITGMLIYLGPGRTSPESKNPISLLGHFLDNPFGRYTEILEKGILTGEEKAILAAHQSNENIYTALRAIFAGQLG